MALSTVSGILTRIGMGKLGRLGLEPARRYERQRPGELIHVDVKKLGRIERGAGKRIDRQRRHNRVCTERRRRRKGRLGVRPRRDRRLHPPRLRRGPRDEKATTAVAFLRRALAFFAATASRSSGC